LYNLPSIRSRVSRGIRSRSLRVDSCPVICHVSNIPIVVVSCVGNVLGTAIRESYRVRSCHSTCTISRLSSVEVCLGVVISNSVLVGIGCGLFLLMISRGRCMVSRGSVDNRSSMDNRGSMISWGMMDNRGMMDRSCMISRGMMYCGGMMYNGGSMVCWGVISRSSMISWSRSMISWSRSMISRSRSMISRSSPVSMGR